MNTQNVLANWFTIHEVSLETNRQGKFSNVQKELIKLRLSDTGTWKQVVLLIAAAIVASIIASLLLSLFHPSNEISALVTLIFVVTAVIGTFVWIKTRVRNRVDKVLNGSIEAGFGKYYFDIAKKKYIASHEAYSLEPLLPISYIPGTYKFYYIKEPAILLSAKSCTPKSVPSYDPETDSLGALLKRIIGFDANDLSANYNGELSEQQKSKFKRILKEKQGKASFVIGHGSHKPHGEVSTGAALLDLSMNLLGPLPNTIYYLAKTVSPTEKYFFYVGDKKFGVTDVAWLALLELSHKAYFLEGTNELLSIEIVTEDDTSAATTPSITVRPITVTADAQSKVYGDSDPTLTYRVTSGSLASGDRFSGSLRRVVGKNVGVYAIEQGSLSAGSNYAITYASANLTISERPITVTVDAKSKTYGDSDPALTYQIASGTLCPW